MVPGIPCGREKAGWDANFGAHECDQPVLEANEDSQGQRALGLWDCRCAAENWEKGEAASQTQLRPAADAGALPSPGEARSQGPALLHTGVMGARSCFLETPAWGRRRRQAALCPDSKGMGTQGGSEKLAGLGETCSAVLLGEKAAETVVSCFLPSGRAGLVSWGLLRYLHTSCFAELVAFASSGSSA